MQLEGSDADVGLKTHATDEPIQCIKDLAMPRKRRTQGPDDELNEFGWRTALLHISTRGNEPVVRSGGAQQMDDAALPHSTLSGEHHALPS